MTTLALANLFLVAVVILMLASACLYAIIVWKIAVILIKTPIHLILGTKSNP